MAADDVEQVRQQVQWAHDHLREFPEMSPEERARIAGARTAYASVLAMFDALGNEKDQQAEPPAQPQLRLVTSADDGDSRTRDR